MLAPAPAVLCATNRYFARRSLCRTQARIALTGGFELLMELNTSFRHSGAYPAPDSIRGRNLVFLTGESKTKMDAGFHRHDGISLSAGRAF